MSIILIFFWLAAAVLAATILLVLLPQHCKNGQSKVRAAFVGFFAAGILLHFPMYFAEYAGGRLPVLNGILSAFHHTLRMFVLDGELEPIKEFAKAQAGAYAAPYFLAAEATYIAGPLLTFGVVLSFFKSASAYLLFYVHLFSKTCIFSELNERSLYLAESIRKNHPKTLIVFTNVRAEESDVSTEASLTPAAIGAICFRQSIAELRLSFHRKTNTIRFFIMSEDESENIRQAAQIIRRYKSDPRMELYLFSDSTESSLLLQTMQLDGMKIRRVCDSQSLVYETLYEQETDLFEYAVPDTEGEEKLISAVILGLGGYGTEMLKALSWFGQMDGCRLMLTAVDLQADAADRFTLQCPELMSPARNGTFEHGEAQYAIAIHAGVDALSERCAELLAALPNITYLFIALGNDQRNIEAAVRWREFCERRKLNPKIQPVVYNSASAEMLNRATNFRGASYRIHCVGSIRERYTEQAVLNPALEAEALARHLLWGKEDAFWRYEFNYRSSAASALHRRMKLLRGIPGADLPPEERTTEDRDRLRLIEHRRWNAYMRSEGYSYSGSREKGSRNDLAKLHNDLIPFDLLTESEKAKDDV